MGCTRIKNQRSHFSNGHGYSKSRFLVPDSSTLLLESCTLSASPMLHASVKAGKKERTVPNGRRDGGELIRFYFLAPERTSNHHSPLNRSSRRIGPLSSRIHSLILPKNWIVCPHFQE